MAEAQTNVPPGAFPTEPMSPLYVGGIPLESLVGALEANQGILTAQQQSSENRFWSTPRRWAVDDTREVFEVSLGTARRVNAIELDLACFPHQAHFFYQDAKSHQWMPVLNTAKQPLTSRITKSIPAVIVPAPPTSTSHPQHYGAGHWVHRELAATPVTSSRFRVVLVRQRNDKIPVNTSGKPVTYSLGIRGFNLGYKVKGRDDVPKTVRDAVIVTERESFSSTTDLLGSAVTMSLRENRAEDLLRGAIWKSEPQPMINAVVNLYLDARGPDGGPQVVDRFLIDPITSGIHANLYYSDSEPDPADADASDNILTFPITRPSGTVTPGASGLVFPDGFGYLDIDNAAIQFDNTKPFWLGLVLQPQFSFEDTTPHVFFDNGALRLEWTGANFLATLGTTTIPTSNDDFTVNQTLRFVLAYDGTNLSLYDGAEVQVSAVDVNPRGAAPATATGMAAPLRIGGLVVADDQDPGHGNFRLNSLILKAESPPTVEEYETTFWPFFNDPSWYVVDEEYRDEFDTSRNAILRYDTVYQTDGAGSLNPYGLVGGPGDHYAEMVWTPIARDYKLHRGYLMFNPVKAKYFKFEFTSLAAMPYDDFNSVVRKVKVFPTSMYYPAAKAVTSSGNTSGGAVPASMSATATPTFSDQVRLYTNNAAATVGTYRPTEAMFSTDPVVAERLRQESLYYSLVDWHLRKVNPKFVDVQKHTYETVEVTHNQRVAYFAGLNSIGMYRLDYATDDDTDQYLDLFHDDANIGRDEDGNLLSGWVVGDGFLGSPDRLDMATITTTSKVFPSARKVTALQFATQQTPPRQVALDADFDDSTLRNWSQYGDSVISATEDFASDIGTMVRVDRSSQARSWKEQEDTFATWAAIEESDPDPYAPTWTSVEYSDYSVPYGGLSAAQPVEVASTGRLYAAARVYAPEPLSAPLEVQIVSADGTVLSSETVEVAPGQVTEWYTGYTIGEASQDGDVLTWQQIEDGGAATPDDDPDHPTWDQMEADGVWDAFDSDYRTVAENRCPNPGLGIDATGWSASGGNALGVDGTVTLSGRPAFAVVDTGGGGLGFYTPAATVAEGETVGLQVAAMTDADGPAQLMAFFYDAAGSAVAQPVLATYDLVAGVEQTLAAAVQVPAGAVTVKARMWIPAVVNAETQQAWGGSALVLPDVSADWAGAEYFDGDTFADEYFVYLWSGLPGASTSRRAQILRRVTGGVTVRVVQEVPTGDYWYMDNLSLFEDSIIWEFSNDAGQNWYPVFDIRNDPDGVFVFPPSLEDGAGTGLQWRVSAARGNQQITSLAIRPWYDSLTSGVPHRETIQSGGPNQSMADQYAEIHDDPRWKLWHKPVPEEWWFTFRQWMLQQVTAVPEETPTLTVLPDSIVPIVGAPALPGPTALGVRPNLITNIIVPASGQN